MTAIPDDIMKAAREAVMPLLGWESPDGARTIARAIMAERMRAVEICSAEREWGGTIADVQTRIETGQQARQIPGWNCEYGDDD